MKKSSFLKILISLTVLSSILISSILGVTNAEYFKLLSKKLSLDAKPDLMFEYNLCVAGDTQKGVYKNSKSFSQKIGSNTNSQSTDKHRGKDFLKVKVPVTEEGYYTLSFNVDFWDSNDSNTAPNNKNFDNDYKNYKNKTDDQKSAILNTPVGCQVYSHKLNATNQTFFDTTANVTIFPATTSYGSYYYGTGTLHSTVPLLDTKGHYHWSTLTPNRAENVELSFYASEQDVQDGFMVWYWDFSGLTTTHNYELKIKEISIDKHNPRENLPYIEFGETQHVNNVIDSTAEQGITRPNRGRGTYATTATFDKLIMQLNPLWDSTAKSTSTPMSFSVPIKNVKANTSYKVYFDFSIAMRNSDGDLPDDNNYRPYFFTGKYENFFENDLYFKSYLHGGPVDATTVAGHNAAISTVTNANKLHANKEMTDYSDLMDQPSGINSSVTLKPLDYTSVAVGNNLKLQATTDPIRPELIINSMTHAQAMNYANTTVGANSATNTLGTTAHNYGVNWLNAIRHAEVCGETKINWLTFYNSTFTFNVTDGVEVDANGYLTNLNWVWAIDGLVPTNWYRVRIDNVRIEEVVPYGSFQSSGMLNIAGVDQNDFGTAFYDTHTRDNFVRNTFRYSNGTGQNYRPRGYVDTNVADANVLSANNIFGAIYDAGDIIINENSKSQYDDDEPLGNYKIGLRGYTAVKSGVKKYVWSVDGGKTWHDMSYEATLTDHTNSNTEYNESLRNPDILSDGEPSMVYGTCESMVDQGFIGLKDYSNKIIRVAALQNQTTGTLTYVKDTTENVGEKNHTYSVDKKDDKGDFVDFIHGVDDLNSVYIYMQADLSEYKNQANLDIVFAAVPNDNPNARCEILRIINYNPMPKYHTRALNIESDIDVTISEGSDTTTKLNAVSKKVDGDNSENTEGLAMLSGAFVGSTAYSNAPTGYAYMVETFDTYDDLRVTFSNMPVKKTLTVKGFAFVKGGTEKYYWSTDYGKTWNECTAVTKASCTEHNGFKEAYYDATTGDENYTGEPHFKENICFTCDNGYIQADLSNYVGQVVDVIFGAKSYLGGPMCPVARIDNVGVYGDDGLFWSRVSTVKIDGSQIQSTEFDVESAYIEDEDEKKRINLQHYWSNLENMGNTDYSFYEPWNVDYRHARFFNREENSIQSGGNVKINGYVYCKGGVKQYKYSLDGGETWTVIHSFTKNISASTYADTKIDVAKRFNNDFVVTDGNNGYYYSKPANPSTNDDGENGTELSFNLPALPNGAERNLLVVAESNTDTDNDGEGNLFPILHMRVKFKYDNGISQYGYYRSIKAHDNARLDPNWVSTTENWQFSPPVGKTYKENNLFNRITIPVTEAGDYKLNFTHRIQNLPQSSETTRKAYYINSAGKIVQTDQSTVYTKLSVAKTHFVVGEPIEIKFDYKYTKYVNGSGRMAISIVNEDFKDMQYALYAHAGFTPNDTLNRTIPDITKKLTSSSPYGTVEYKFSKNSGLPSFFYDGSLPAGTYKIYLIHVRDISTIKQGLAAKDKWLYGELTIYIHDPSEAATLSVVHDDGKYTYFSDTSRNFIEGSELENNKPDRQIDTICEITDPFTNDDARGITADVTVTPEDVKRGYIILQTDYTSFLTTLKHSYETCKTFVDGLKAADKKLHTDEQCLSNDIYATKPNDGKFIRQYPKVNYNITIDFGSNPLVKQPETSTTRSIPFGTSKLGYGTTAIKIPVTEADTYDLSFGGYLNSSVYHHGFDRGTTIWKHNGQDYDLTINYTGAYMSLPKSVYVKGEDIPVSYYTKGSVAAIPGVNASGNRPWIGIFKYETMSDPDDFEDKRHYVEPETAGVEYISTANLEAGTYNIYLRDNSALLFYDQTGNYWWKYDMVDPITVYIIDPENSKNGITVSHKFRDIPNVQVSGNDDKASGTVTLDKNVFYQGEDISVDLEFTKGENCANYRLAIAPQGSNDWTAFIYAKTTGKYNIKTSNFTLTDEKEQKASGSKKIPPGKYTLYFLNKGNIYGAHKSGEMYAAIDITILPEASTLSVKGGTQIHSLYKNDNGEISKITQTAVNPTAIDAPFSYYNINGTVTVTKEDVERGYVFFEYDFTGFAPSTDFTFSVDRFKMTKKTSP